MTQTILITGSASQLARCLALRAAPPPWRARYLARGELDIADAAQVAQVLDAAAPDCIINTAAHTAVDRAESEPVRAWRVNAEGVANLAGWCRRNDARLIHISTDFVFDGLSTVPYAPGAEEAPLGEYGASKLAGEREMETLPPRRGVVLRASWLYSEFGNNFVKTMLRLMKERDEIAVVNDQIGCPTSAHTLAALIWRMVEGEPGQDLYHWNDGGTMSWFEFAREIRRQGLAAGLLRRETPIRAISSAQYPTTAARPAYSAMGRSEALAEYNMPATGWRDELSQVIRALARGPRLATSQGVNADAT